MLIAVFMLAGFFNFFTRMDLRIPDFKNLILPDFGFFFQSFKKNSGSDLASLIASVNLKEFSNQTPIDLNIKQSDLKLPAPEENKKEVKKESSVSVNSKKEKTVPPPKTPPPKTPPALPKVVEQRKINEKSIVALRCHYTTKNNILTDGFAYKGELLSSGTGVVVNPAGYILTTRHLVDPLWINQVQSGTLTAPEKTLNENKVFDYCEVGFIRDGTLPGREDIINRNLEAEIKNPFLYVANSYFLPKATGFSDKETNTLDFAILKITGAWKDCKYFGGCNLPASFDYNPVFIGRPDKISEIISYGTQDKMIYDLKDLTMKGAIGILKNYHNGDKYFNNEFLDFDWKVPRGMREERIGSPVFWKGYVVGINYALEPGDYRKVYTVGTPAINKILQDNNLGNIFARK